MSQLSAQILLSEWAKWLKFHGQQSGKKHAQVCLPVRRQCFKVHHLCAEDWCAHQANQMQTQIWLFLAQTADCVNSTTGKQCMWTACSSQQRPTLLVMPEQMASGLWKRSPLLTSMRAPLPPVLHRPRSPTCTHQAFGLPFTGNWCYCFVPVLVQWVSGLWRI